MDTVNDRESEIPLAPKAPNDHDSCRFDISLSSSTPTWTYDVFLNFRGEDTRRTFVGHLFQALCSKGMYTYKDDPSLEKGKLIFPELLEAIEESLFAIIIFSKDYASSTWCLEELVKIMECQKTNGQTVLPIFYDVEPSDIRKQRNSFADAFAKHERDQSPEKVQKWREALDQAAGIAGWHSCNFTDDYEFINTLVEYLHRKLHQFEIPGGNHNLVGVGHLMEEIIRSMDLKKSNEVRMVGIHGKGGIGKTSIARALFDKFSHEFGAVCFLDDVGQISKKQGISYLQEILLSEILKLRNVKISSTSEGMTTIMRRIRRLKVLIVLDGVDHAEQLEALAGNRNWFGAGSRVIITARDRELLHTFGADGIHKVHGLSYKEAKELFSLHAFGSRTPGFFRKHLVGLICSVCRLPSSLKAWASLVRGRDIAWKEILKTLMPIGYCLFGLVFGAISIFNIVSFVQMAREFAAAGVSFL